MSTRFWWLALVLPNVALAQNLVEENLSGVAQDQPYFTQDVGNSRLIFTEQNLPAAAHAAAVERRLQSLYEANFGFAMDYRMAVGLMSSHNQIANGYSTQYPLNRQINYLAGAEAVDYFATSRWLDTLLSHETAHNYQHNAKNNVVSRSLFKVLRNGSVGTPLLPSIVPNLFESRFMLEGNAVLNESWHGQGGRLYSGRFRAMTHVHAKAGYLTPARLYNATLNFPYGEGAYTFGAQFQYFLAENYGLEATNHYFNNRSRYWFWPFMVNRPMRLSVGENFDRSVRAWAATMAQEAEAMQLASGPVVARSHYFGPLNRSQNELLFLTSPKPAHAPLLNRYDTTTAQNQQQQSSLATGRVFELDQASYTVDSRKTSVWRIHQGLFDEDGRLKPGTAGKIYQGSLADGREVYFDTVTSYLEPQLYVGDQFYGAVNSSVLVHNDDLYYFVQNGRERTLFRNREAVATVPGFYSIVCDVDDSGRVYFIANSATGSSLFRTDGQTTERVLAADNVIDARLTQGDQVLVAAISADDYYYSLEPLAASSDTPFDLQLFWDGPGGLAEQQAQFFAELEPEPLTTDTPYGLLRNIRYSGGNIALSTQTEDDNGDTSTELLYAVNFRFADPLARNSINFWAQRDKELSDLMGVGFTNNQFFLLAGLNTYYVAHDGYADASLGRDTRDFGVSAELRLPFLQTGFWRAELAGNYYQDYQLDEREPLAWQLAIDRRESYGTSWLTNQLFTANLFTVDDRGDTINGAEFNLGTDFPAEFYLRLHGKYANSDTAAVDRFNRRGVELKKEPNFIINDPSNFYLPALSHDLFAERVALNELSLTKVLNYSGYTFKGPLSIRREGVDLSLRRYAISNANGQGDIDINQAVVGFNFDLLVLNVFNFAVTLNYTYSDDDTFTERNTVNAGFYLPL
ncbi:hypothetical protein [Halioxenophilus sp. WMMB6]|uniref:hypothetical protein n=1 Tax=Halioxenophilus sp. WMMB6 TaxID=3073815 RepID=UPI00295F24C4|nr:hypothetical protein [Halioxenophilus sp. WMMB6]